jgi:uncharacterized protein (TIGR02246 family)
MKFFSLALAAVVLAGCSDTPAPVNTAAVHDAAVQAIKDLETAWAKDSNTKDVDKFLAYYTDDAAVLEANMPLAKGKVAIRAALKPMLADPAFALTFKADKVDVATSGDLGFSQGTYSMTMSNPNKKNKKKKTVTEKGKYLTVYQKQADGSWKAVEDTQSPDGPPV